MEDMIDKRNQRERIARSIIKRRNVIYSPEYYAGPVQEEQPEEAAPAPESEDMAKAQEIIERLEREAREEEEAKQAEIRKAVEEVQEQELAISRILGEKEAINQHIIEETRTT